MMLHLAVLQNACSHKEEVYMFYSTDSAPRPVRQCMQYDMKRKLTSFAAAHRCRPSPRRTAAGRALWCSPRARTPPSLPALARSVTHLLSLLHH